MICLVCSDFPRQLIIEAVRTLPLQEGGSKPAATNDLLFEQYDIEKLQCAVCIFFYFSEFMENLRTLFMETAMSTTLNINEQCTFKLIFSGISNLISRLRPSSQPLPTVESVLEIMISKADPKARSVLKDSPICLVNDLNPFMSGQTISYLELC